MRFKLLDFYGGAVSRICMASGQNGKGYTSASMTFEPGKVYETNDPTLIKYIKGEMGDVFDRPTLTKDLKSELELAGVKYTLSKCGTCANAKVHAVFNPFVEVEETEDETTES